MGDIKRLVLSNRTDINVVKNVEEGIIASIQQDCDDLVIAWADKLDTPWSLKSKSGEPYDLALAALRWYNRPAIAYKIIVSPKYQREVDIDSIEKYFYNLVYQGYDSYWYQKSKGMLKIREFLGSGMAQRLRKPALTKVVNLAWYSGRMDLVKMFAESTSIPTPKKQEPGLKEISFNGTTYDDLSDHPAFECKRIDDAYSTCLLTIYPHRTIYETVAGIEAKKAVISFIDDKVAEIKVFFKLAQFEDKKIVNAISTKYRTTPVLKEKQRIGLGGKYTIVDYYFTTSDMQISLEKNVKIGTINSLAVLGMNPALADQFSGVNTDITMDILTLKYISINEKLELKTHELEEKESTVINTDIKTEAKKKMAEQKKKMLDM